MSSYEDRYPDRAPTLMHAIGNRTGGRVRLRTCTLEPYGYVTCEHPQEFLDAIPACPPEVWIRCDDGSIVQLRHVVKIETVSVLDLLEKRE